MLPKELRTVYEEASYETGNVEKIDYYLKISEDDGYSERLILCDSEECILVFPEFVDELVEILTRWKDEYYVKLK